MSNTFFQGEKNFADGETPLCFPGYRPAHRLSCAWPRTSLGLQAEEPIWKIRHSLYHQLYTRGSPTLRPLHIWWGEKRECRVLPLWETLNQGCQTRFSSGDTSGKFNLKRAGPVQSLYNTLVIIIDNFQLFS